jgi:hypothetical protein
MTVADTQVSCLQDQVRLRDWPHWKNWKQQLTQQGFQAFPPEDEYINFQMLVHFNQMSGEFTHGALNHTNKAPSLRHRDMGSKGAARWDRIMATTTAREDFKDDHQITIDNLRLISAPTLSMFGEYSHCLESCRQLNNNIGTSRVKILPEVGHFLPAIKPRLFMYTLRQFMLQFKDGPRQIRMAQERRPFRERRSGDRRVYIPSTLPFPFNDRHGDLVLFDRRKPMLLDSRIVSNQ